VLANFSLRLCFCIKIKLPLKIGTIIDTCFKLPVKPFGFLTGLPGFPVTLDCDSDTSFPVDVKLDCNYTLPGCPSGSGVVSIFLQTFVPGSSTSLGNAGGTFYCAEYAKVDAWLCCALYDLAIDRKVIRYVFMDAWLTGAAYMPQFKYKSKTKSTGTVKDKFCGPGGDKLGSDNYKNQQCCNRGGGNFESSGDCNKCIVRGPDPVDKDKGNTYQQNNYNTGASDIEDMIYCPESYPMKIVNLGRLDACPDVVDGINRRILSQDSLLELYQNSTCTSTGDGVDYKTCLTGTYFESGYDTEQWVNDMGLTTYQNPAMVVLKMMTNCSRGVEGLFGQNGQGGCNEYEVDDWVYRTLRLVSRTYTDVIIDEVGGLDVWSSFDFDPQQTPRFNPTDPQGDYGVATGTDGDDGYGDLALGDPSPGNSLADIPYFYFGLKAGRTAIDKLRKEYLIEN
jgi:hypothetical protein